jgi:phosphohistidine phosphatase
LRDGGLLDRILTVAAWSAARGFHAMDDSRGEGLDLWLVRHAPAEDAADDDVRALSERGRKRFARAALGLDALALEFDQLWTSPLLRARQTAELLSEHARGEPRVVDALAAAPDGELLDALASCPGTCLALVGHEPWLSQLAAWLVFGSREAGAGLAFKKGGLAWLSGTPRPGGMRLRAFLPPRVLRALANEA